jgi:hypothetical protein
VRRTLSPPPLVDTGELKPLDVERETWPGKYPDGDGLYLIVASTSMACRSISRSRSVRRSQLARNLVRDRFRRADEHAVAVPADFERSRCRERIRDEIGTIGYNISLVRRAAEIDFSQGASGEHVAMAFNGVATPVDWSR